MRLVQPHQLRDVLIIADRPEPAPKAGPIKHPLQPCNHRHSDRKGQQRQHPNCQPANRKARRLDRAALQFLRIGGIPFQQGVLQDHRQPECHQQWRQDIRPQRLVQQSALQHIADCRHQRHHDDQRNERMHTQQYRGRQPQIGRQHDQIAMGDIHQSHHTENKAKPRRE